jgi:hypothetical protein
MEGARRNFSGDVFVRGETCMRIWRWAGICCLGDARTRQEGKDGRMARQGTKREMALGTPGERGAEAPKSGRHRSLLHSSAL